RYLAPLAPFARVMAHRARLATGTKNRDNFLTSEICFFRRRQCVFIAFDLLFLNGKDLRTLPLIERKTALKKLLRRKLSRILYLEHVEGDGRLLFEQIVAMDLEAIVASGRIHRKRLPRNRRATGSR